MLLLLPHLHTVALSANCVKLNIIYGTPQVNQVFRPFAQFRPLDRSDPWTDQTSTNSDPLPQCTPPPPIQTPSPNSDPLPQFRPPPSIQTPPIQTPSLNSDPLLQFRLPLSIQIPSPNSDPLPQFRPPPSIQTPSPNSDPYCR